MKVKIEDLQKPKTIDIIGDEAWLDELYSSFTDTDKKTAKLSGKLELMLEGYGYAKVDGSLSYSPKVACSRCADPITWPITKEFTARFKPKDEVAEAAEVDLQTEDLDFYYIENEELDLQQVIIDVVMTSLPSQLVKKCDSGKSCGVCGVDLQNSEVYRSKTKEEESPFAALKKIRFPN